MAAAVVVEAEGSIPKPFNWATFEKSAMNVSEVNADRRSSLARAAAAHPFRFLLFNLDLQGVGLRTGGAPCHPQSGRQYLQGDGRDEAGQAGEERELFG